MRLREFARDIPWSLWAIALVAVFSHPLLLSGLAVPTWLLPAALLAALAIHRPEWPRFDDRLVTGVFAVGFLAIAYGSIATADRSWDGLSHARWGLHHRNPHRRSLEQVGLRRGTVLTVSGRSSRGGAWSLHPRLGRRGTQSGRAIHRR